jgi:hypothetical protein
MRRRARFPSICRAQPVTCDPIRSDRENAALTGPPAAAAKRDIALKRGLCVEMRLFGRPGGLCPQSAASAPRPQLRLEENLFLSRNAWRARVSKSSEPLRQNSGRLFKTPQPQYVSNRADRDIIRHLLVCLHEGSFSKPAPQAYNSHLITAFQKRDNRQEAMNRPLVRDLPRVPAFLLKSGIRPDAGRWRALILCRYSARLTIERSSQHAIKPSAINAGGA